MMRETERGLGRRFKPGKAISWPLGIGLGATLGYFLDPDNGHRRRRLLQDKATHFKRTSVTGARKAVADAENRFRGAVAEVRARVAEEEQPPDDVLLQRVRSRLGHVVAHPRAVEVRVEDGRVTLSGPTLEREADGLLREIRALAGVRQVFDELERFESASDVPGLQGGRERKGHRFIGTEWTPAYRMFGIATSLPLIGYGMKQRGASGGLVAGLGASLLARSVTNLSLGKLTGIGAGPHVIGVRKHFRVEASPEDVFFQLRHPDNVRGLFSRIDAIVPSTSEATWEIVSHGPVGLPLHWEAELTELEPNRLIAWRSVEGGRFQAEGRVQLSPADDGGTIVDLQIDYNPPGGVLGEALATLLGAGLRHALNEDVPRIQRHFATLAEAPEVSEAPTTEKLAERAEEPAPKEAKPATKTGGDVRTAPESGDRTQPRP